MRYLSILNWVVFQLLQRKKKENIIY
jgi:hypothetical protein